MCDPYLNYAGQVWHDWSSPVRKNDDSLLFCLRKKGFYVNFFKIYEIEKNKSECE